MSSTSSTPTRSSPPLHMSMPSPPAFPHRSSSRSRLHLPAHPNEPPVPPRLVGSELLRKVTHPETHHHNSSEVWIDGDEFGTRKGSSHSSPITSPALTVSSLSPDTPPTPIRSSRRTQTVTLPQRARSHSPPPTPSEFRESGMTDFPFPEQTPSGIVPTHVIHDAVHDSLPELNLLSSWTWSPSSRSPVWERPNPSGVTCKA